VKRIVLAEPYWMMKRRTYRGLDRVSSARSSAMLARISRDPLPSSIAGVIAGCDPII
jgi:hypothetical protein